MSLESGVHAMIANAETAAAGRVYPERLPQEPTLPAVTYLVVDAPPQYHRDGDSLDRARVQLSSWAETATAAIALRDEIHAATSGFSGAPDGETFLEVLIASKADGFETGIDLYQRIVDLIVWHRRA